MNAKLKGWRIRRKAIEYLESENFMVGVVESTSKFAKQKDLFGVADLVAVRDGFTSFIQVTCNRPHKHEKYLLWNKKTGCDLMQMVWYDRRGWVFYHYLDGEINRVDWRK